MPSSWLPMRVNSKRSIAILSTWRGLGPYPSRSPRHRISSHSCSWMSSRTASRASMFEWTSEMIPVPFIPSLRGERLQHVELHDVHLLAAGIGHFPDDVALERQEGGGRRA